MQTTEKPGLYRQRDRIRAGEKSCRKRLRKLRRDGGFGPAGFRKRAMQDFINKNNSRADGGGLESI